MKNVTTKQQVLELNVTDLRKLATQSGIKNCSKFQKVELQQMVIKAVVKEVVKKESSLSKSDLLRKEIRQSLNEGLSIDSGRLMKVMADKYDQIMHRSFIITVRNNFIKLLS